MFSKTKINLELVEELNKARKNPREYSNTLSKRSKFIKKNSYNPYPHNFIYPLVEGKKSYDDAVSYLEKKNQYLTIENLAPFVASEELSNIADDFLTAIMKLKDYLNINEIKKLDVKNYISPYGIISGLIKIIIYKNDYIIKNIVNDLVVNDGDKDKKLREIVFNKNLKMVGMSQFKDKNPLTVILLCEQFIKSGQNKDMLTQSEINPDLDILEVISRKKLAKK
jgi:hypothetical protein